MLPGKYDNPVLMGAFYMLISCVSFSIMGGLIRYLSLTDIHPFVIVFYRTLIALIFLLPTLRHAGFSDLKTTRMPLHLFRGISSSIAAIGGFYAISVIPLATAVSYSFIAPILATVLAVFFLKEKIHLPRILALFFGFVGVIVILRPGLQPFDLGTAGALGGAIGIAVTIICVRLLSRTDKVHVIALYSLFFNLPIALLLALFFWQWPSLHQFMVLTIIGILSGLTQIWITRAMALAEPSAILPLDFTRLIFATAIGIFFFDEIPDNYVFFGAGIIMVSTIYIAHREARVAQKRRTMPSTSLP